MTEDESSDIMPPHEAVQGLVITMVALINTLVEAKAVDGGRLAAQIEHTRRSSGGRSTGANLVTELFISAARRDRDADGGR